MADYKFKTPMVDAIDDGKIVRVPETYARREGLPILRRREVSFLGEPGKQPPVSEAQKKEARSLYNIDTFRKPLKSKKNDIRESLIDNFQWIIAEKRRLRNLTRKQLAENVGVIEHDIKLVENGVLPSEDFILVNKLEQFFNMSLRKDGMMMPPVAGMPSVPVKPASSNQSVESPARVSRYLLNREKQREARSRRVQSEQSLVGNDIEIDFKEK